MQSNVTRLWIKLNELELSVMTVPISASTRSKPLKTGEFGYMDTKTLHQMKMSPKKTGIDTPPATPATLLPRYPASVPPRLPSKTHKTKEEKSEHGEEREREREREREKYISLVNRPLFLETSAAIFITLHPNPLPTLFHPRWCWVRLRVVHHVFIIISNCFHLIWYNFIVIIYWIIIIVIVSLIFYYYSI